MYIIILSSVTLKLHRRALERIASEWKNYIENTFTNLSLTFVRRVLDLICSQWSFFFILKWLEKLGMTIKLRCKRNIEKPSTITRNVWMVRFIPEGRLGLEDRGECFAPYIKYVCKFVIDVCQVSLRFDMLTVKLFLHTKMTWKVRYDY